MREQIERILQKRLRPILASHGGDVQILCLEENALSLRLIGQCANCPSGMFATQQMIREALQFSIPKLEKIEFDQIVSPELLVFAREMLNHEHTS